MESLTALVEHHDGRLEIIDRGEQAALPGMLPAPKSRPAQQPQPVALPVPAAVQAAAPDTVA